MCQIRLTLVGLQNPISSKYTIYFEFLLLLFSFLLCFLFSFSFSFQSDGERCAVRESRLCDSVCSVNVQLFGIINTGFRLQLFDGWFYCIFIGYCRRLQNICIMHNVTNEAQWLNTAIMRKAKWFHFSPKIIVTNR